MSKKNLLFTGFALESSLSFQTAVEAANLDEVGGIYAAVYPSANGKAHIEKVIASLEPELRYKFREVLYLDIDEDPVPYPENASPEKIAKIDILNANKLENLVPQLKRVLPEGEYIDGVLHAIANMHPDAMGSIQNFMTAPWSKIQKGLQISAHSYLRMMYAFLPVLNPEGTSSAALTFHSDTVQPNYGWMRPAKKLLEEITKEMSIFLGPLGHAVNTVTTGVWKTRAAQAIPGYDTLEELWAEPHLQSLSKVKPSDRLFFESTARLIAHRQVATAHRFNFDNGMSDIGFCVRRRKNEVVEEYATAAL